MAEMSKELMELINSVPCCYVATASKDEAPNVTPMGSTRAVSTDTIVLMVMAAKTFENLKENSKVAIAVNSSTPPKAEFSKEKLGQVAAFQIKGTAAVLTSGDMFEQTKAKVTELLGPEVAGMIKATAAVKVEEIYSSTPGPDAGKRIA